MQAACRLLPNWLHVHTFLLLRLRLLTNPVSGITSRCANTMCSQGTAWPAAGLWSGGTVSEGDICECQGHQVASAARQRHQQKLEGAERSGLIAVSFVPEWLMSCFCAFPCTPVRPCWQSYTFAPWGFTGAGRVALPKPWRRRSGPASTGVNSSLAGGARQQLPGSCSSFACYCCRAASSSSAFCCISASAGHAGGSACQRLQCAAISGHPAAE